MELEEIRQQFTNGKRIREITFPLKSSMPLRANTVRLSTKNLEWRVGNIYEKLIKLEHRNSAEYSQIGS